MKNLAVSSKGLRLINKGARTCNCSPWLPYYEGVGVGYKSTPVKIDMCSLFSITNIRRDQVTINTGRGGTQFHPCSKSPLKS